MTAAKTLRAAPAYATYASDDLARVSWYGLSAGERGLLESMARAYWVDGYLPSEPRLIALACRLETTDVQPLLTGAVLAHFESDDIGHLHHVELRRQLQNIAVTREKQSLGGKTGAAITNANRSTKRKPNTGAASQRVASVGAGRLASIPAGLRRVPERTERTERTKSTSSLGKADFDSVVVVDPDPWVQEYEAAENSIDHDRLAAGE
jgi:hypothetical protein